MHHLSIDLETFSSVPLTKAGAYKYIQSPDFEILLAGYSLDGAPRQIVDLAQGERLPPWFAEALTDKTCIKHAYNAAFEWGCLSKFMGTLPPDQWQCTMLHGLHCGYPGNLEAVGKAVGLPQDKQKLSTGKFLIRYFCTPCAATKSNGGRTRNLPHHDPARWQLFKEYCMGDVTTEMEVLRFLSNFPVPDAIQRQWQTDLIINSRGVAVDMELVHGALYIGETTRKQLMEEAVLLSGLSNPNSVKQLLQWLEEELDEEMTDLRKDTVSRLLGGNIASDTARRMLEIRQELGKTSTKKYNAIEAAVCADGRCRGLLQFYGANRTGRWAGRLVQVQNLPRTYTNPLPLARDLIKRKETTKLRMLYGSVPDTLSQMIRTSLVAAPGHTFIDADFSSIEARVLAWLTGEEWKLEVFRTHGKIYEASASMMFGVPIELIKKGNPEYELRQRGKVAELGLGYGMGASKFRDTAERQYGVIFTEEEAQDIVNRWRDANKRIRDFWYKLDAAAVTVIKTGASVGVNNLVLAREVDPANGLDFMTIRLPNGRKLYYAHPHLGVNKWGGDSIAFKGMDQTTKKWKSVETYGAKLTENVVQAIARDCLADAVERVNAMGYKVVFHVHDEIVIEFPGKAMQNDLDRVAAIMSQPMQWAPDLPLGADGWIGDFYKKD